MQKTDLNKETMYEGVKMLVECEHPHIHLPQQKLYTLFTLGLQYFLFLSTKKPGHYILRVEDSFLFEKLQKKCKDPNIRKFLQCIALPRRFKYGSSYFYLDFFNISTWAPTNDLPKNKIQGAIIVKNAHKNPIMFEEQDDETANIMAGLPENYYLTSLTEFVPKTITIAFDERLEGLHSISFPFIKDDAKEKLARGVNIYEDIDLDNID